MSGFMERYRSGHNEAVLKTVCPQGRVGSNPTLSVNCIYGAERLVPGTELNIGFRKECDSTRCRSTQVVEGAPLERE